MFDWKSFLDEAALAALFPREYARFARPVRDSLIVFLEGLPAAHQAEIVEQQASLPLSASISERLAAVARCCPVLQKLGQVLAHDQRLAPELRQHLRPLESLAPTVPEAILRDIVVRELGPLDQIGICLQSPAIAEASVAVVVPFVEVHANRNGPLRDGVLKILKPGIEERLALELELLGRVGSHLDERCEALQIPRMGYADLFEQIREKLSHEICLDEEQRHLKEASACYADDPRVQIPKLLEYCTPRITAMERVTGSKVTDRGLAGPRERSRLAETLVEALIAQPIFSRPRAMFHSDPHGGNLFLTDENRLAILDWSLVGFLGEQQRIALVQILLAAAAFDSGRILIVLESLNVGSHIDRPALAAVVDGWLKRIRRGMRPGFFWLTGMLDEAVSMARVRFASDLMLFRKSLHTLDGVIAEISAGQIRIDDVLLLDFFGHLRGSCRAVGPRRRTPVSSPLVCRISTCASRVGLSSDGHTILDGGMSRPAGRLWHNDYTVSSRNSGRRQNRSGSQCRGWSRSRNWRFAMGIRACWLRAWQWKTWCRLRGYRPRRVLECRVLGRGDLRFAASAF